MSTVASDIDKSENENTDNIELQQLVPPDDNDDNDIDIDEILKQLQKTTCFKDEDNIDMLDQSDFYKLFTENDINIDKAIINTIFNTMDVNNDGYIAINDYLLWMTELNISSLKETLDMNDDSKLSNPPAYIGQSSLAMDEDIIENDDQHNCLMQNQSSTKMLDLESNTPPSTERMGTGTQTHTHITTTASAATDVSINDTDDGDPNANVLVLLPAINEANNDNDNDDDDNDNDEEEEEKYTLQQPVKCLSSLKVQGYFTYISL